MPEDEETRIYVLLPLLKYIYTASARQENMNKNILSIICLPALRDEPAMLAYARTGLLCCHDAVINILCLIILWVIEGSDFTDYSEARLDSKRIFCGNCFEFLRFHRLDWS